MPKFWGKFALQRFAFSGAVGTRDRIKYRSDLVQQCLGHFLRFYGVLKVGASGLAAILEIPARPYRGLIHGWPAAQIPHQKSKGARPKGVVQVSSKIMSKLSVIKEGGKSGNQPVVWF